MAQKFRTQEELNSKEYNYFLAFKISIKEKNAKKIEAVLLQEKNKFVRGGVSGMRYQELWEDITEIMLNDSVRNPDGTYTQNAGGRTKEAEAAKNFLLQSSVEVLAQISRRGNLFKSEVAEIAKEAELEVAELEQKLTALFSGGVKYIDDTKYGVDYQKFEKIDHNLLILKTDTLYDFFSVKMSDPLATINTTIANFKHTLVKTSESTAANELIGAAKTVFKNEDTKRAYDHYVLLKDAVWGKLVSFKERGISLIPMETYLEYINVIKTTLKLSLEDAETELGAWMKKFRITIEGMGADSDVNVDFCPYDDCKKPFVRNDSVKVCPHCGKPLEVLCWNCQSKVPYSSKVVSCPKCGLTAQMKPVFEKCAKDLDLLLSGSGSNISDIKSALNKLKNVVPSYERAPTSDVAKRIASFDSMVQDRQKVEETTGKAYKTAIEEIDKQIAQKNFAQANNLLAQLKRKFADYNAANTNAYLTKINAETTKSQGFVAQAKRFMAARDEAQIIANAAKALEVCADNLEAQQILRAYPPKAPMNLRVVEQNDKVRLEWATVGAQNMTTFSVVRKIGSAPKNNTDGTVVANELTINFYEDNNLVAATEYYYGVFADRCGVSSALVTSTAPTSVILDVRNVTQETVAEKISVKWSCSPNVAEVEVWKKDGFTAIKRGEGQRLYTVDKNGFVDENGSMQGNTYFIVCVYDVNGTKKYSKGIQVSFKCFHLPKKVQNITFSAGDAGRYCVTTAPVSGGELQLYYAAQKVPMPIGKEETRDKLSQYGKLTKLDLVEEGANCFSFALPKGQTLWIYPVNMNEQLFISSEPVLLTTIDAIGNLTYENRSGVLTIKANFSSQLKEVIVKVSNNKFAKTLDDEGDSTTYSAAKIRGDNGIVVNLRADSISYVSLFAKVAVDNFSALCLPVALPEPIDNRKKQAVKFALQYEPSPVKPFVVSIKFESETEMTLPELVLVRGMPCPRTKNAGQLVEKVGSVTLKKGLFTHGLYCGAVKVKVPPMAKGMKLALFPAEDNCCFAQLREVSKL